MNNRKMNYDDSPAGKLLTSYENFISECFPEKVAEDFFDFRDLYIEIYTAWCDATEIRLESVEKYNRLVKKFFGSRNNQTA